MDLNDFLGPQPLIFDLKAANRWDAIDELIRNLADAQKIKPADASAITACVRRRETAMSTGIGYRVAIPHASTDLVTEVIKAIGRSRDGIDFESLDGQKVNLVFIYLVPKTMLQQHLHTLANLARLLQSSDTRTALWTRFFGES